jgi:toxin CcdB
MRSPTSWAVQSSLFDGYRRRVVVPLVLRAQLPRKGDMAGSRLNPVFRIEGVEVVLHPLDTVSVAAEQLGQQVASLADDGQRIADAVDKLLTRSWG